MRLLHDVPAGLRTITIIGGVRGSAAGAAEAGVRRGGIPRIRRDWARSHRRRDAAFTRRPVALDGGALLLGPRVSIHRVGSHSLQGLLRACALAVAFSNA